MPDYYVSVKTALLQLLQQDKVSKARHAAASFSRLQYTQSGYKILNHLGDFHLFFFFFFFERRMGFTLCPVAEQMFYVLEPGLLL